MCRAAPPAWLCVVSFRPAALLAAEAVARELLAALTAMLGDVARLPLVELSVIKKIIFYL